MSGEENRDFSGRLTKIQVTSPEFEVRHYISNDELDLVRDTRPGAAKDICLVSAGGFLGAILPSCEQIGRFNSQVNPMGFLGLFTIAVTFAMLISALITAWLWSKAESKQENVVDRIRSRPKFEVR